MLGALGGEGDENFRAGDDLEPGGMMLANPCLVKAELVEPLHQLEVAFEALRRVLLVRMERRQEDPVAQVDLGHRSLADHKLCEVSRFRRHGKHFSPQPWRAMMRCSNARG